MHCPISAIIWTHKLGFLKAFKNIPENHWRRIPIGTNKQTINKVIIQTPRPWKTTYTKSKPQSSAARTVAVRGRIFNMYCCLTFAYLDPHTESQSGSYGAVVVRSPCKIPYSCHFLTALITRSRAEKAVGTSQRGIHGSIRAHVVSLPITLARSLDSTR
jgi:hypothetical protein